MYSGQAADGNPGVVAGNCTTVTGLTGSRHILGGAGPRRAGRHAFVVAGYCMTVTGVTGSRRILEVQGLAGPGGAPFPRAQIGRAHV